MVIGCLEGRQIKEIAKESNEFPNTVILWRDRFIKDGIKGLEDSKRSGKPVTYGDEFREQVLKTLETTPPNGLAHWDGPTLAQHLKTSQDAIWRLLKKEGICLARQRTWCVSTDPEFIQKAADIVGLYLNPPINAIVLSIDEKPSIQALSRKTGSVVTKNGKTVRAIKSTYRRNGTQNLFAALEVATGKIHPKVTKYKKRVDFISFMDDLLLDLKYDENTQYHVILDNYCIHKRNSEWLEKHQNIHFHFTPTSASWLNQVEIWFGILTRKVLVGASFDDVTLLTEAIKSFIKYYNESAEPFVWRKREVVGSQLKNTIKNLRN
jgi:transposase